MAQNISLKTSSQSSFTKAVKNIKTLIKRKELKIRDQSTDAKKKGSKGILGKGKGVAQQAAGKSTWKQHGKGVVRLSHIPDGFHEDEMHSYFSQFGRVTRLNLVRSKKNGNSKGYAFIEFLYSEVAQVVAETMNNYLMSGRLLKAEYMPGDSVGKGMFRNSNIRPQNCPRRKSQKNWIVKTNKILTPEEESKELNNVSGRLNKIKKQLEDSGIHLDCQVEGASLALLNTDVLKPGRSQKAVLEIDESDEEIEFKIHPNVTKVLKHKSISTSPSSSTLKKLKAKKKMKSAWV